MVVQSPPPQIDSIKATNFATDQLVRAFFTFLILYVGQGVALLLNRSLWSTLYPSGDFGPHSPSVNETIFIIAIFIAIPMLIAISSVEYSSRINNLSLNYAMGFIAYCVMSAGIWTLLSEPAMNENARLALPTIAGSLFAIGITTALAWFYVKKSLSGLTES